MLQVKDYFRIMKNQQPPRFEGLLTGQLGCWMGKFELKQDYCLIKVGESHF